MSTRKESIREFITARNAESLAVLAALAEADWSKLVYTTEGVNWTVRDVLAHLSDSEKGQLGQAQSIAAGKGGVPPDFDLNRWNKRAVEKRAARSPAELLADVQQGFTQTLAFLDGVAEADLDKVGRHASGQEMTVEAILRRMAAHRATHAAEIKASLGV